MYPFVLCQLCLSGSYETVGDAWALRGHKWPSLKDGSVDSAQGLELACGLLSKGSVELDCLRVGQATKQKQWTSTC